MAFFDHFEDMNDVTLKPRLLHLILKDHIPDKQHPFRSPSMLSHTVSLIKTHRLLSESVAEREDREYIENWKSAVDAWVNRLMMLVSSNMPDKCWAGVCLLGLTCQECSSERFLASYLVWFDKLLLLIQPPEETYFVKVASCASISDLFTRLGEFPTVNKDETLQAAIQPILTLLNENDSDAVWEGVVCLLCTIITVFPSSLHQHYDSVEAAIVLKIMSEKCNVNMLKKLGHCLALLPRSRGDEDSWLLMMQKVLLAINIRLNDAFQGLEEETNCNEAMRVLVSPGRDPPPPLGGHTMLGGASDQATKRPELLLISGISALMLCCHAMLTTSYHVQVTVPVRPLLALARRMLMVDGSLSQSSYHLVTAMRQEFICSELPLLHSNSLELLLATVNGAHSRMLPHAAEIILLITEYFRKCLLPELRIKVYSIIKILLLKMGLGIAMYLNQEIINNAFIDLDSISYGGAGTCFGAYSKVSSEAVLQPSIGKRTYAMATASAPLYKQPLELKMMQNPTDLCLKIAALEALEALLMEGGGLRSASWRSNVDRLLIIVATNACEGGWGKDEKDIFFLGEPTRTWADFQLAALHALLASFLSAVRIHPPYLAQALELFRSGKQEGGTKIAEFCAHALQATGVLIHPRSLPLVDFPSATGNRLNSRFRQKLYSSVQKQKATLEKEPGDPESDNDDLYSAEELLYLDGLSRAQALEQNELEASTADAAEIRRRGKEIMVESSMDSFPDIVNGDSDSD